MEELSKAFEFKSKMDLLEKQKEALTELISEKDKSIEEKDQLFYRLTNDLKKRKMYKQTVEEQDYTI